MSMPGAEGGNLIDDGTEAEGDEQGAVPPWVMYQYITLEVQPACGHRNVYSYCEGCRRTLCFDCWLAHTVYRANGRTCEDADTR